MALQKNRPPVFPQFVMIRDKHEVNPRSGHGFQFNPQPAGTDIRSIPASVAVFSLILILLFLSGCQSTLLNKIKSNEFNEQYYIDAKLNFAIKHPLNWKRIKLPVASPKYQANTVHWQIENPHKKSAAIGDMLIQSLSSNTDDNLPDLLSHFLTDKPELKSGQAEQFEHPAGLALKLLGHDDDRGRLTIALQGQQHDFIISLNYPNNRFDELLPVFQDIVASFTEIIPAADNPKSQKK